MQNIQINPGSIYDVICGGGTYSRDEVWEALEKSSLSDDVHAMPMQLETLISEGGTNLSGGHANDSCWLPPWSRNLNPLTR